jgi:uncharacterized membrane protein
MHCNSSALIQQLQQFEQQIADVPRYQAALHQAVAEHNLGAFACAKLSTEHHFFALAVTTGQLRVQVVPADGLGDALDSLSELVLRAVRMVLLADSLVLRDVLGSLTARHRSSTLLPEPYRTVDDLISGLHEELDRITGRWKAYHDVPGVDRTAYRAALRTAHASMRELASDSRAARFLQAGLRRTEWPELQDVCGRMEAALALQIDIEPDTPLLVHPRTLRPVAGRSL